MSEENPQVVRQPLALAADSHGDRFLVIGHISSSGLRSGAATDTDFANLFTLSTGRVIREQVFFNRAEALEAVGLSE